MSIDLTKWCARESDPRGYLWQPASKDGFLYATNGHIAIRVTFDSESWEPVGDHGKFPFAVMNRFMSSEPVGEGFALEGLPPAEPCEKCKGTGTVPEVEKVRCDDCNGQGEFDHGNYWYHCKNCDGEGHVEGEPTGKMETCDTCHGMKTKPGVPHSVGAADYDLAYLHIIAELPNARLFVPNKDDAGIVTFDGGRAAIMPMRK